MISLDGNTVHPLVIRSKRNFQHFNAFALIEAANGYRQHLENDGWMFLTLAGAMSTAELGISIAEMIRQGKIHGICCTGANLEEDIFNLIAHNSYKRIPNYRELTPADEIALFEHDLNRVTDHWHYVPKFPHTEDYLLRLLIKPRQKYL